MALPSGWQFDSTRRQQESGQAFVYPVIRHGDTSRYALKRLKNPLRRDRFERELDRMRSLSTAGLQVPLIVDSDTIDNKPWFVMPWFERGSLQDLLDRYPTTSGTLRTRLELFRSLCVVVQSIHDMDVAHRDLKPANILMTEDGTLVVTDFGLCRDVTDDRLTEFAEGVGSRFYIAPENEGGFSEAVDQRPADFYALGKICWTILSGCSVRAREEQSQREWRLATLHDDPRLESLDAVLSAMIAPDVRRRLASWTNVLDEVRAVGAALTDGSEKPAFDNGADIEQLKTEALAALRFMEYSDETRETRERNEQYAEVSQQFPVFTTALSQRFSTALDPFVSELLSSTTEIAINVGGSSPAFRSFEGHEQVRHLAPFPAYILNHTSVAGVTIFGQHHQLPHPLHVGLYGVIYGRDNVAVLRIAQLVAENNMTEVDLGNQFPMLLDRGTHIGWPSQDSFIDSVVSETVPLCRKLILAYIVGARHRYNFAQMRSALSTSIEP